MTPTSAGRCSRSARSASSPRSRMRIEPTYDIRQDVWLDAPFATVLDHFDEIMAAGYSVSVFTDFGRPDDDRQDLGQVTHRSNRSRRTRVGRRAAADARSTPITGQDTSGATQQLGVAGPWHARLPHFRLEFTPSNGDEQQSEYLLPREHGAAAFDALRSVPICARRCRSARCARSPRTSCG